MLNLIKLSSSLFNLPLYSFRLFHNTKYFVPINALSFIFSHSPGPGGQNVNKNLSRVELRFNTVTKNTNWLPDEILKRFIQQNSNKIHKDGIFSLFGSKFRSQNQNKKYVIDKLQNMIDIASIEEPVHHIIEPKFGKKSYKERKKIERKRSYKNEKSMGAFYME